MKFHDTLNENIWDLTTEDLIPEVKEKLEEIAEAFIEFLEIPTDAVLNKVITGSSASYNYNEFSDLDLHIIVDYDKVHEDCPLVNGYLNSLKKQFNDNHDITIHGVPVELYAEQKDQGTVHNGLYSLNTGWIDKPQKIAPTDNDAAVEAKFNEIKELVDKCDDSEEATELLNKIYNMRKAGLAEAGEFCTENLAFKKLRNEGCMDKLRKIKKEQIDKQLSLESYNSVNETVSSRQKELKKVFDQLLKEIHDFGGGKILDIKYGDGERPYYSVDIKNCGDWYKEDEDNECSWDIKWSSYDKFRDIVDKYRRKYRKDKIECTWDKSIWYYEDKKIHIVVRDDSKPHKPLFEGVEAKYSIKNESIKESEELKVGDIANWNNVVWVKINSIEGNKANVSPIHQEDIDSGKFEKEEIVLLSSLKKSNESIKEEVLPHNINKVNQLIDKINKTGYFKIDGEDISVNKGFGTVGEQIDLQSLAEQFEELGFKVRTTYFQITVYGLRDFINKQPSLESYNESDSKHVLDLSFQGESGWINHVVIDLDDELYEDIKKYNIKFIINKRTIDELEKDKEHLIDEIDDDIREYVDDTLVLTAFYNTDSYYSTLLFDGGDDDILLDCVETLVDKIKKEMNKNESIKEEISDMTKQDIDNVMEVLRNDKKYYYDNHITSHVLYISAIKKRIAEFLDMEEREIGDILSSLGYPVSYNPYGTYNNFVADEKMTYEEFNKYIDNIPAMLDEDLTILEETLRKAEGMKKDIKEEQEKISLKDINNWFESKTLLGKQDDPEFYIRSAVRKWPQLKGHEKELRDNLAKEKAKNHPWYPYMAMVTNTLAELGLFESNKNESIKEGNIEDIVNSLIDKYGKEKLQRGLQTPYQKDYIWGLLHREKGLDLTAILDCLKSKLNEAIKEDMATLEKKVDTADNDLHDILTSLENTISEALEENFGYMDEPIEDEYEQIRDVLDAYADSENAFIDGFVTFEDLRQFDADNWLKDWSNDVIRDVALEMGYEVDGDKILDPSL